DHKMAERGVSYEALAFEEHQEQAADQVSIANTITSIRFLGALEWREFFETCSLVEQILREDPAGVYSRMDFVSRDRYRHAVEMLARRSPRTEIEIAEAAVSLALESLSADASDPSAAHVGFYLISTGRLAFEQCVGYRPRLRERLYRGPLASKGLVYWGLFALITIVLAALLTSYVVCYNASLAWTVALVVFSLAPLAGLALDVVNRLATHLWPARVLPKLDFHEPVAAAHRTMVVIPALLTSPQATQHIIDNLEIAYLSNRDPNILFGLIGDLPAHAAEVAPGDAAVIDAARHGISALNEAYRENGIAPFSLFIRGRSFNGADEVWMGWERKRGALEEFNRLLRGSNDTSFSVCDTDRRALASVTFVITLDADTVLPHDGARKLISTIAHPLNRAQIDVDRRRVLRGYGLVQPRVSMSLESAERSPFAWMHSGQIGIDPYAGAVSDAYQDVFGEGSFTGKGIYEVDVYNAVLQGRLPENTLLSHDLLEGSYLRTALASDIEVLDDQPSSYVSHTARSHRWVRGDWQTLPWLGRMVPTRTGRERNPLTMLHRWKILDNLRRSLSAPSLLLLAVCGWVALPGYDWAWLAIVLAIELFPVYFGAFDALVFRSRDRATRRDFRSIARDYWRDIAQLLVALVVLPHQAYMMLDAIARALYRMFVTHRNMLEWETAADVERRLGPRLADFGRRMWTGEAITFSAAVIVAMLDLPSLVSATPLLLAWAIAPYIAWRVSLPTPEPVIEISDAERASVRRIARRTWRFFETFVTPEDHYLAPDNFQEDPEPVVAHRTSPTNMGLQLISGLTAYDLGFIGLSRFVDLTSRTLSTMVGLERYRGHFYNWYDTTTLQPLRPSYVSTVDSGNLAGHLVALRAGLMEVSESPLIGSSALTGIAETVRLALEELLAFRDDLGPAEAVVELRTSLEELLRRIRLDQTPADLGEWWSVLSALASLADTVTARLAALRPRTSGDEAALASVTRAVDAVRVDVHYHLDDLERYTPWAPLLGQVPRAALTDESLSPLVSHTPSLVGLAEGFDVTLAHLDELASAGDDTSVWAARVAAGIREARPQCVQLLAELRLAADMAQEIWEHTDFSMLFDRNRMLFSIGFNTAEGKLEESFYDMLASECRLASYVAIAKGDVPQEHWFRLGRAITETEAGRALVSWSASMFEYLMPLLVMKSWPGTLLDQTYRTIVRRQIQYGQQRGVPWGVSESAFAARDAGMIYQYQAFGIPGLGLKRGLSEDVVVAPYATVLALPLEPHAALQNLDTLA
ncbi:MAG: glucoamylase family protein, partial [Coriobacteriales bacterium]